MDEVQGPKGPKEVAFDTEIAPLLQKVYFVAEKHGINAFLHFILDDVGHGVYHGRTATIKPSKDRDKIDKINSLMDAVQRPTPRKASPGCGPDMARQQDNPYAPLRPSAERAPFLSPFISRLLGKLSATRLIVNGMANGSVRHPYEANCPVKMHADAFVGTPYTRGEN